MSISAECPDALLFSVDFLDGRLTLCFGSRLFSLPRLFNFFNCGFCLLFNLRWCLRLFFDGGYILFFFYSFCITLVFRCPSRLFVRLTLCRFRCFFCTGGHFRLCRFFFWRRWLFIICCQRFIICLYIFWRIILSRIYRIGFFLFLCNFVFDFLFSFSGTFPDCFFCTDSSTFHT